MRSYQAKEIAEIVNGKIVAGDGLAEITDCSTDSRERGEGLLFVPVIGERVDAHDFIADAYKNGMRAVFTSRGEVVPGTEGMTYIQVEDTVAALQQFAAHVRDGFNIPIIGVTGSVGKTTTKEMIAAALAAERKVLKTEGNMNSQVGLPKMMLRLKEEHEIAVIEMGMSLPGEMARLARVAKPTCAVITNIGVSHIGQLGSKENIRREKLNIINELPERGLIVINADDPLLAELKTARGRVGVDETTKEKLVSHRIVTYGTGENADYQATDISYMGDKTFFLLSKKNDVVMQPVILSTLGEHNVLNALAAIAVAEYFDVEPKSAVKGLMAYEPTAMRGGKQVKNGITVIDDTYNASPDSMKGGIDILLATKAERRIAVLADMLELGALSESCHREVGAYLAAKKANETPEKSADLLVAIGTEARYFAAAAEGIEAHCFENNKEALQFLKGYLKEGDAVLVKGSRGMHLEEIVDGI